MLNHSTIDREAFSWVYEEIQPQLDILTKLIGECSEETEPGQFEELISHTHEIGGALEIIELRSLSRLMDECEFLLTVHQSGDVKLKQKQFTGWLKEAVDLLRSNLDQIKAGRWEDALSVVELINRIREARGVSGVDASAFFSPPIEVYPEINSSATLSDAKFKKNMSKLRRRYQNYLLRWLRDQDSVALRKMGIIFGHLQGFSSFGPVARLWWVAIAYSDYVRLNSGEHLLLHGRILREINDIMVSLEQHGQSALVRDPQEELVRLMLFYLGMAEQKSDRMREIVKAFNIEQFFPQNDAEANKELADVGFMQSQLEKLEQVDKVPLATVRQLVTSYFEGEEADASLLLEIREQLDILGNSFARLKLGLLQEVVAAVQLVVGQIDEGELERNEDCSFHLAAALLFVENSVISPQNVDPDWLQKGNSITASLQALSSDGGVDEVAPQPRLTFSERKALLKVVAAEVEENLNSIEANLELFAVDPSNTDLLNGIDAKIRQVRGALQVLGEQKIGLLLKMAEKQFTSILEKESEPTPQLIEALAIAVGTMEEYVKGLLEGRRSMDYLLDRSITDLEVAVGKRITRADVEELLDQSSDSLFSWLDKQSDFELFAKLKSNLRDLLVLAKKTRLTDVEGLVKEQDRFIDMISQEPAFLSDNIVSNLQNNMGAIAEQIIQLYGTEETPQEKLADAKLRLNKSAIKEDPSGVQYHDDMDLGELDDSISIAKSTQRRKEPESEDQPKAAVRVVDDSIFNAFLQESGEVLQESVRLHGLCMENMEDREATRELRRGFHTLKGSARMVGLSEIGELAWYCESLLNYVLDTGNPLSMPVLEYANEALVEMKNQHNANYGKQHLVDIDAWGAKAEEAALAAAREQNEDDNEQEDGSFDSSTTVFEGVDSISLSHSAEEDQSKETTALDHEALELSPIEEEQEDLSGIITEAEADRWDESVSDAEIVEYEVEETTYSVVSDNYMRDTFIDEARKNLGKVESILKGTPVFVQADEALSIAMHTLFGNARTLKLKTMAKAYAMAEKICADHQMSGEPLSDAEVRGLGVLCDATRDSVDNPVDQFPYFKFEKKRWAKLTRILSHLHSQLDFTHDLNGDEDNLFLRSKKTKGGKTSDRKKSSSDEAKANEGGQQIDASTAEIDNASSDEANKRVKKVLDELEPMDELLIETDEDHSSTDIADQGASAELEDMEDSLEAMHEDMSTKSSPTDEELSNVNEESLIPDDMADLLDVDVDKISIDIQADSIDGDESTDVADIDVDSVVEIDEADEVNVVFSEPPGNVPDEVKNVFVNELRNLRDELDEEVAKLSDLATSTDALANIMRSLHTIKGSAMMADAPAIADFTHRTESYLEENFIRDQDDLKTTRKHLELYIDEMESAEKAYLKGEPYRMSSTLARVLGHIQVDQSQAKSNQSPIEDEEESDWSPIEVEDFLNNILVRVELLNSRWKQASDWGEIKSDMLICLEDLFQYSEHTSVLRPITPVQQSLMKYCSQLQPHQLGDSMRYKAIIGEIIDQIITASKDMMNGAPLPDFNPLFANLPTIEKAQQDENNIEDTSDTEQIKFSPAGQADSKKLLASVKQRTSALRIRTETLDSLTNYVGDSSMNRSQMREDVLHMKSVIDGLYNNVQSFSRQLRELDIEADRQIASRTSVPEQKQEEDEEFDPLELDRYTKLQQLSRGLAENLDELDDIQSQLTGYIHKAESSLQKQDRLNRELQDEILQVRLVSFGGVAPQLRQVIRTTARKVAKDVELEIIGAEVRLDKAILDGVLPALEHMLRNAVDHGIELPDERVAKNKSHNGKVTIECRQVAREIVITIRDDGAGLDFKKIRQKAIDDNRLSPAQKLTADNVLQYISQSGFTTARELTAISGRGVGMDVVQTTLRKMSGTISYDENEAGIGTQFTLRLPISLAVTSAMFLTTGGIPYAVSARSIDRVINVDVAELTALLEQKRPTIKAAEQEFLLVDLADYLGHQPRLKKMRGNVSVILATSGVQNIAIIAEELQETQEIVIKSLGEHIGRIPIFGGATIRADGSVVLLLDLVGLSFFESDSSVSEESVSTHIEEAVPLVLVIDDSLTVRKSAQRDISGLGLRVAMAKDGRDAQSVIDDINPDLLLLDIEMPNMDGFEFLRWFKNQERYESIPVVMISSRATEKYVIKATELGSADFLGKPYLIEDLVAVFNKHMQLSTPLRADVSSTS